MVDGIVAVVSTALGMTLIPCLTVYIYIYIYIIIYLYKSMHRSIIVCHHRGMEYNFTTHLTNGLLCCSTQLGLPVFQLHGTDKIVRPSTGPLLSAALCSTEFLEENAGTPPGHKTRRGFRVAVSHKQASGQWSAAVLSPGTR